MSQTLYRKYRPKKFSDLVDQNHVKITLTRAVASGKISHAYLFTGPRGVGKTTAARIFAKAVNCKQNEQGEPCDRCEICQAINKNNFLDLIELDAASKRKIEEIKDFKELIKYQPNIARFKVFIIDEVHMLTDVSFNALLKTIEEPPDYAIFILCTTAAHKIPETIVSRCQRFDFKKISHQLMVDNLRFICQQEGVDQVDNEVLAKIAFLSSGSLRDAQGFLGQLLSLDYKKIDQTTADLVLPNTNLNQLVKLWRLLLTSQTHEAINLTNEILENGEDIDFFLTKLIELYRFALLYKISEKIDNLKNLFTDQQYNELTKQIRQSSLVDLKNHLEILLDKQAKFKNIFIRQLPLELAIVEITSSNIQKFDIVNPSVELELENTKNNSKTTTDRKSINSSANEINLNPVDLINKELKNNLVDSLLPDFYSLSKIITTAEIYFTADKNLFIQVEHNLHKNLIEKKKNLEKLISCSQNFFSDLKEIKVQLTKNSSLESTNSSQQLNKFIDILGGSLVDSSLDD